MMIPEKYRAYLMGLGALAVVILLLLWIGEIILPFLFAMFIAYLLNPTILKIQKIVKNRNVAITGFLTFVTLLFLGVVFLFGNHIVKDSKRLVSGVQVFAEKNAAQIEGIKSNVLGFVGGVYENEEFRSRLDTLVASGKEMDVTAAIGSVYSFFNKPGKVKAESRQAVKSWSSIFMLLYTLLYTVFIMYSYKYFEDRYVKYFGDRKFSNNILDGIWLEFKNVFVVYFKQRTKVVFINWLILILVFTILDLPGGVIIAILAALLSYASQFHYLSLPLVGIGCWVLSVEDVNTFFVYFGINNFFAYFGIILAVYILISILEETVYFDKIMHSVNGLNSAIMMLSFTLWISIFGGLIGTIVALPLTRLILIFTDRLALYSKDNQILG